MQRPHFSSEGFAEELGLSRPASVFLGRWCNARTAASERTGAFLLQRNVRAASCRATPAWRLGRPSRLPCLEGPPCRIIQVGGSRPRAQWCRQSRPGVPAAALVGAPVV